jgi:integrase
MFDAISDRNTTLTERLASPDAAIRASVKGVHEVGVATQHRILATLRKALNDAIRRDKILYRNEALLVELPTAKRPKAMVWTHERVTTWQRTGVTPGPVMVWTPAQTGSFLDHAHAVDDRLYALYHLIVFTGLRRGEVCGVHWDDVDLDAKTLTVRWQIVQNGWATEIDTPKTSESPEPGQTGGTSMTGSRAMYVKPRSIDTVASRTNRRSTIGHSAFTFRFPTPARPLSFFRPRHHPTSAPASFRRYRGRRNFGRLNMAIDATRANPPNSRRVPATPTMMLGELGGV